MKKNKKLEQRGLYTFINELDPIPDGKIVIGYRAKMQDYKLSMRDNATICADESVYQMIMSLLRDIIEPATFGANYIFVPKTNEA